MRRRFADTLRAGAGPPGTHRRRRAAPGPSIDPRIAARRAQVASEESAAGAGRRRAFAVTTVGLATAVALGALAVLSPWLSVRVVEVTGAERTGVAAVRSASGLASRPPLVRVDHARVTARIAALPWVDRVTLDRRWPRTVAVVVVERQPAAVAPCASGREGKCLVDAAGRVLAPVGQDPKAEAELPRLGGLPAAGEPGSQVEAAARGPLAVAVALPASLRSLVREVRGEGSEVALELRAPGRESSPPMVRLGTPDRITEKLTATATVLARTSVNGVGVLDVRVPESPTLIRSRR